MRARKSNPTRSSFPAPSGTSCTWYLTDYRVSRHVIFETVLAPLHADKFRPKGEAGPTSRGTDQESVVRVEHGLGVRALEREEDILVSLL